MPNNLRHAYVEHPTFGIILRHFIAKLERDLPFVIFYLLALLIFIFLLIRTLILKPKSAAVVDKTDDNKD